MQPTLRMIWVKFAKEGIHKYPAALEDPNLATGDEYDVSFLGYPHRHMFHFRVEIEVFHDDRDVEFIQFKRELEKMYNTGVMQLDYKSCEMMAQDLAKPVIIATQMMESMMDNITPNRAEVNDVANAVMDGADAVMLSGETSVGKHPIEVIKIMSRIINEVENNFDNIYVKETLPKKNNERFITDSICFNVCRLAQRVEAKAIITMTHSGYTAYKISSQRPKSEIFVFSSNKKLLSTLSLVWGVSTFYYNKTISTDHTIADITHLLKTKGYAESGDLIINTASIPLVENGKTNMLKLSYID